MSLSISVRVLALPVPLLRAAAARIRCAGRAGAGSSQGARVVTTPDYTATAVWPRARRVIHAESRGHAVQI